MSKRFMVTQIIESGFIHADSKEEALNIYEKEGASDWCNLSTEVEEVEDGIV